MYFWDLGSERLLSTEVRPSPRGPKQQPREHGGDGPKQLHHCMPVLQECLASPMATASLSCPWGDLLG